MGDSLADAAQPAPTSRGRWSQARRLEFIDFRLRWNGRINRADLTDFFGISVPQASIDLARYADLAPANLVYDRSARVYVASPRYQPQFAASAPERFLSELLWHGWGNPDPERELLGAAPPVAVVRPPARIINPDVLVALQRAIREQTGVHITYQSLSRPSPIRRIISPHAFGHDGFRWHVRAHCHVQDAFRDFVLARVVEVGSAAARGKSPRDDVAWHATVKLVLAPNPKLPAAHKRAIELDYGMHGGEVVFECRQALLFYVLHQLRLDTEHATAAGQQIVLKNRREVAPLLAPSEPTPT